MYERLTTPSMRIAIYGSRRQQPSIGPIAEFLRNLHDTGIAVLMHCKLYAHLCELMPQLSQYVDTVVDGNNFDADLVVSLGGDGTILRTAMWVAEKGIPIIGFNTGHLGFLTAEPVVNLPQLTEYIRCDRYTVEARSLLEVASPQLPAWCAPYALNEVAVSKVENSSMINVSVSIDGAPLAEYRADGLVVCTATGSTAYNLSVGGPIVQPTMDVCVLSPVAAHSLSMRPLVVGADSELQILPQARARNVRLSLDSRSVEIPVEQPVILRKAPFRIRLLQRVEHTFADRLRDKLHWGDN